MINFKDNWLETKQRYDAWLHGGKTDRPLMSLRSIREKGRGLYELMEEPPIDSLVERYTNMDKRYPRMMNRYDKIDFLAESYPQSGAFLGPGSLAIYIGSEPVFTEETVWFSVCIDSYDGLELKYDPKNEWWKKHLGMIRRCVELASGTDIIVGQPDLVENVDILSAMRGPNRFCFDLYDYPDEVKKALAQINDVYAACFNEIYELIKKPDGSSAYGPYNVYGSGKSAKIQVDFSALISPEHFDEFVLPYLVAQCEGLDNILFHLDGVECIVHLDSLLKMERLGAIQWTPPAGPSSIKAANERWFDLYRKIRRGGKGLWLSLAEYGPEGSIEAADKIIKEIGPDGLYFQFPEMEQKLAESLMLHAERDWRSR
ncbi:MAG: hypothetical protein FWH01_00555 [Oscillospiraceae bacterium]|nr:hypothetical protein [Oscillospiraceae bacterium]